MTEGSPFMFPKPKAYTIPWWERVRCVSRASVCLCFFPAAEQAGMRGMQNDGRSGAAAGGRSHRGRRLGLRRPGCGRAGGQGFGLAGGLGARARERTHTQKDRAPRTSREHRRPSEEFSQPRGVCLQVDAENAIENSGGDNFITWHIRQFMDDPAATTAMFYKHVADRKAAADHVYVARHARRTRHRRRTRTRNRALPQPARRTRCARLPANRRCLGVLTASYSVTALASPIKTDGFWRQPQNNWSTVNSRTVMGNKYNNPYNVALANLEKHS